MITPQIAANLDVPIGNKKRPEAANDEVTPPLLATLQSLEKQADELKAVLLKLNEETRSSQVELANVVLQLQLSQEESMKKQGETNKLLQQLELSRDEACQQDRDDARKVLELIQQDRVEQAQTERARIESERTPVFDTLSEQTKRAGHGHSNTTLIETEDPERPAKRGRVTPTPHTTSSTFFGKGRRSESVDQIPAEVASQSNPPNRNALSTENCGGDLQHRKRIRRRSRSRRSLGDDMESIPTLSQGSLVRGSL